MANENLNANPADNNNSPAPQRDAPILISYTTLRRAIGIIAFTLPFVLVAGECIFARCCPRPIQASISQYYYTRMGPYFVAALGAVALFLYTYKGYTTFEDITCNVAGVLAIGVAFVPMHVTNDCICLPCMVHKDFETVAMGWLHFTIAASLLLILAIISISWFTKTKDKNNMSANKKRRNIIYYICGWGIIVTLVLLGIYFLMPAKTIPIDCCTAVDYSQPQQFPVVLIGESICLWLFGISWLVKGEVILPG